MSLIQRQGALNRNGAHEPAAGDGAILRNLTVPSSDGVHK